jgi:hypothetical protein
MQDLFTDESQGDQFVVLALPKAKSFTFSHCITETRWPLKGTVVVPQDVMSDEKNGASAEKISW